MILFLIYLIDIIIRLLVLLVIVHVFLTYFLSPFHPVRQWIDRIVEPLLTPIRRYIPVTGMFDFSPLILIILIQILGAVLKSVLNALL